MIDSGNTTASKELDNAVDWLIVQRKKSIMQWIGCPMPKKWVFFPNHANKINSLSIQVGANFWRGVDFINDDSTRECQRPIPTILAASWHITWPIFGRPFLYPRVVAILTEGVYCSFARIWLCFTQPSPSFLHSCPNLRRVLRLGYACLHLIWDMKLHSLGGGTRMDSGKQILVA